MTGTETTTVELADALDRLIERFSCDAVTGREEYEARTGRVFQDDEIYEARTAAFLEWLVLERPLKGAGAAPVVVAFRERPSEALRALSTSLRSLFVVQALEDGQVRVQDLLDSGLWAVAERRRVHGVEPGDILEARLIGWRDQVVFGRTFCYHPKSTHSALGELRRRIRGGGGSRIDVVDYAAQLSVRALRYRHVAAERVYEETLSSITGDEERR